MDQQVSNRSGKVTFKQYAQNQIMFLPPCLEDYIPEKHLVKIVNQVIDRIALTCIIHSVVQIINYARIFVGHLGGRHVASVFYSFLPWFGGNQAIFSRLMDVLSIFGYIYPVVYQGLLFRLSFQNFDAA